MIYVFTQLSQFSQAIQTIRTKVVYGQLAENNMHYAEQHQDEGDPASSSASGAPWHPFRRQ